MKQMAFRLDGKPWDPKNQISPSTEKLIAFLDALADGDVLSTAALASKMKMVPRAVTDRLGQDTTRKLRHGGKAFYGNPRTIAMLQREKDKVE